MATEIITLSDLAVPQQTKPKPAIRDATRCAPNHGYTGATLRRDNDSQITGTRHDNGQTTSISNTTPSIDDQTSRLPFNRLMLVYACLATAYFTSTLDINAVATALPVIGTSLNAGTTITWTGTAYLMGQAACQPLYGRLSDVFGRKPILMLSLLFIVIGGILCGFAQTPTWLYICRALSGVGGGGVSSVVAIVVSDLVSMRDRGKYQGILSAAIGLGSCSGPFIAAEMLRRGGEAWRWIFWAPPIMASGCLVGMGFLLPLRPVTGSWKEKVRKIDWAGLVVAVVAMVFLLVSRFLSWFLRWVVMITANKKHSYRSTLADRCGLGTALWWYRCSASALLAGFCSSSFRNAWPGSLSFRFDFSRKDQL
jgi:MFS family permease